MKLVIVDQEDNLMQVCVDGYCYQDLDGSQLAENIHAVQWKDTVGEIEYKDPATGRMTHNEEITDISAFQFAVDIWQAAFDEEQAAMQEAMQQSQASDPAV